MRIICLTALVLFGAGCAESVDPNRLLIGRWGTSTAELIALRSGAELHLPHPPSCLIVVFDEPLELTDGNEFGGRGEIWTSGATDGERQRATISGSLDGSGVQLQVALGAEWFPLSLESGVAPDPEEVPTCPL